MIISTVILSLSWQHILIVALILLLLFGGKKIPELMKGLGSGIKEFKDAVKDEDKKNNESSSNSNTNNNPS
ncbi:twin-arginine translocase TatA/TatE family subunit [Epilithonimonas mollis]|uniref:Sec-independent protein translocase protein TatA n=1 Tax=Epilithonimonas mollis TaxID=216903 RepID=A0A1M6RVN5_9FLAO|nr:twin-arginine translocase TatA/TatE family subunit [Epilithonimonas mollis]SHK36520.1 sec-independent protein translocase protein TatA [Epilithonimonas mollis]